MYSCQFAPSGGSTERKTTRDLISLREESTKVKNCRKFISTFPFLYSDIYSVNSFIKPNIDFETIEDTKRFPPISFLFHHMIIALKMTTIKADIASIDKIKVNIIETIETF